MSSERDLMVPPNREEDLAPVVESVKTPGSELQLMNSNVMEAEQMRAQQEVQAQLVIAHKFPRNEIAAVKKILDSCSRAEFAKIALFRFPRAGKPVEGETIRTAEMMANAWGNITFGFDWLQQEKGRSYVASYCWDMQTNTKARRTFFVEHAIQLQGGKVKHLTDPRDIYEKVANEAQRRVRACILEMIPIDIRFEAVARIKQTSISEIKTRPLIDQVKTMVLGFAEFGVTEKNLVDKLGHPIENTTAEEIHEMRTIFKALDDKMSKPSDFFAIENPKAGGNAGMLNELLEGK